MTHDLQKLLKQFIWLMDEQERLKNDTLNTCLHILWTLSDQYDWDGLRPALEALEMLDSKQLREFRESNSITLITDCIDEDNFFDLWYTVEAIIELSS